MKSRPLAMGIQLFLAPYINEQVIVILTTIQEFMINNKFDVFPQILEYLGGKQVKS
jgi:hypothetical protein